jgi:hypothetical protein
MQHFKTWCVRMSVLAIYALVGLFTAALGPVIARAQVSCPPITIQCPNGKLKTCSGSPQGQYCYYDRSCMNGGTCGS